MGKKSKGMKVHYWASDYQTYYEDKKHYPLNQSHTDVFFPTLSHPFYVNQTQALLLNITSIIAPSLLLSCLFS